MCSSIVSTVMGATIIILYSFLINGDDLPCYGDDCKSRNNLEEFTMAFSVGHIGSWCYRVCDWNLGSNMFLFDDVIRQARSQGLSSPQS